MRRGAGVRAGSAPPPPELPAALPPEKPLLNVPWRSHENCLQPEVTAALRIKQSHLSAFPDPLVSKLSCAKLQVPSRCGFEAVESCVWWEGKGLGGYVSGSQVCYSSVPNV